MEGYDSHERIVTRTGGRLRATARETYWGARDQGLPFPSPSIYEGDKNFPRMRGCRWARTHDRDVEL